MRQVEIVTFPDPPSFRLRKLAQRLPFLLLYAQWSVELLIGTSTVSVPSSETRAILTSPPAADWKEGQAPRLSS
jgi:hypothetical protein